MEEILKNQKAPRPGITKFDHNLWQFSCLLVPTQQEIDAQQRKFDRLFFILAGEVTAALNRGQNNDRIPKEINFKVNPFIAGSFANGTAIGGLYITKVPSDMDVIMELNEGSTLFIRPEGNMKQLYINNTPINYGTREAIRKALLEAIDQVKYYPEFAQCVFRNMNEERHRYTFETENWECDILPALSSGAGIYYFLNCEDEHELSNNQYAAKAFNELADSRPGLRNIIRCLKFAKKTWNAPNIKIPSCIFEVAASEVAVNLGHTRWDQKKFKDIWIACWEYILNKVLANAVIPAPNNPRSDLIKKLKTEEFINFCSKMRDEAATEEKLFNFLTQQFSLQKQNQN